MKKVLLFIFIFLAINGKAFSQISDTLSGYPLDTAGWTIGGSAIVVDSTVLLAGDSISESGYAYYDSSVTLTICSQFTVDFDFRVVEDSAEPTVADGIAFWFLNDPPTGTATGSTLGLPTDPDGLVMVMDTYDNVGLPDLNPKEGLFYYNGTATTYVEGDTTGQLCPVVDTQYFITNGLWHHCKITYSAGFINVYFNHSSIASLSGYKVIPITGYFGFSSSTGADYSAQSIKDVIINVKSGLSAPTVTSPVTYCQFDLPSSPISAIGGPLTWYLTATSLDTLPAAPFPNTGIPDTTIFYVRQGKGVCISPPDSIKVIVHPKPLAPDITGDTLYCTGDPFVPFYVTGDSILWYTTLTGGSGIDTAPVVNTSVAGISTFYATQTVLGCKSDRDDSITVIVNPTPAAPIVTGDTVYCQFFPFIPFTVTGSHILWYTAPTGGTGTYIAPVINTSVAGTYDNYVTQTNSAGCESPRELVPVVVHPKPEPPTLTAPVICQYLTCPVLSATGESGSTLTWYGPGLPASGSPLGPNPSTAVPGIDSYYVTQTVLGCISDSAVDGVITLPQPPKPLTYDTTYCQFAQAAPLNAVGSQLQWSRYTFPIDSTPVPPTNYTGPFTWDVTQSITTLGVTCQSEDTTVTVTILYLPQFSIAASNSFVCQYDSITLSFDTTGTGDPALVESGYSWVLPQGASAVNGTNTTNPSVVVQFDSTDQNNYVYLTASDYTGMCSTTDTIRINVVAPPTANASSKLDICQGDTTSLYLSYESPNAAKFTWTIDTIPLSSSTELNIIRSNSNSGGPFSISWIDSGIHIIELNSFTKEGCPSLHPTFDTVDVHPVPDASFIYKAPEGNFCLEDSVLFTATADNYGYAYTWAPENVFNSIDKSSEWGMLKDNISTVTLTVTDPLGCSASTSQELDPGSCCTVFFPNAFTPNGDGKNDKFRPLFNGYHEFHNFRIANRWGQTIFESSNNTAEWDGNYNGVPQDMGTYYYYIKFDCGGKSVEQKGGLTLIR